MTYCLAIQVNKGIVFASDSRTNAGVDYVATQSKMHSFLFEGDRSIFILTAGSLATSQSVIHAIETDLADESSAFSLTQAQYLHEIAEYIGALSQKQQKKHAEAMEKSNMSAEASFLVGGQIRGQKAAIFHVYPQGNFIQASSETPYLQIGENKYGKPILDRVIANSTTLEDAARCALVSLDSTIRSNISVGPPIELAIHSNNQFDDVFRTSYGVNSPLYKSLQKQWNEGLKRAFKRLPRFDWEKTQ